MVTLGQKFKKPKTNEKLNILQEQQRCSVQKRLENAPNIGEMRQF